MTRWPRDADAMSFAPVAATCPESIAVTAEACGWSFPTAVLSRAVCAQTSPMSVPTTTRPAEVQEKGVGPQGCRVRQSSPQGSLRSHPESQSTATMHTIDPQSPAKGQKCRRPEGAHLFRAW